ncbi:MAG: uroporphyrinogen-III synthase [Betaproteobacteria bacterium]|nr:uroporphyrinogen-III synthase [Betaproteobacteria bacterium]
MVASPRVLVTRPESQAQIWAQALCAHGIAAEPFALIEIAALADPAPLHAAWRAMPGVAATMFVSANAVTHFMAQRPAGLALSGQAWGTGTGTAQALLAAGWPAAQIRCPSADAPRFDSEALWALVADEVAGWPAARQVLIVRGADAEGQLAGRDWLAQRLLEAGVQVTQCVAYVRRAPRLEAVALAHARQALAQGHWWLFGSSEAAHNLLQAVPEAPGPAARALATHPRIAERLRAQGWREVHVVPATLAAQVASIESLT